MDLMWRVDKLKETVEKVLIMRIKFIGDDEQTYRGYPSNLIEELAFAIDEYLKSDK